MNIIYWTYLLSGKGKNIDWKRMFYSSYFPNDAFVSNISINWNEQRNYN